MMSHTALALALTLAVPGEPAVKRQDVKVIGNGHMAIPRFPRLVERVDDTGRVVATEDEPPWHDHIVACLHVAMRMAGHDLPWPLVFAASGQPWRFAFDPAWTHDVEHVMPMDALAAACDNLGFDYTALYNRPWPEVREAIADALAAGRPVLAGLDPRYWCIIVGLDRSTGEYLTIGGSPNRHWTRLRAGEGASVPDTFTPAECLRRPIPTDGFSAGVMGPQQVARNPVFILGARRSSDGAASIQRVLQQAIALMGSGRIDRVGLDLRREMRAANSDFPATPRAGTFQMGNDGIRAWAAALEARTAPTHDFGFIHAIDTSLGMQLRGAAIAADFLDWAAAKSDAPVQARLRGAAQRLRRTMDDPAILTGYNGYLPGTLDPEGLAQALADEPRLSYIATPAQREVLEGMGFSVRRCPWGYSVLPDQPTFEIARARAVERLRAIAAERDEAGRDLIAALDAETQETSMLEPIQMTPPDNQNGNIYARGMAAILDHLGCDLSYEDILGLTGVAFILQVDTSGPFFPEGNIDAAWWPNDPWGFYLGLPVLSQAAGWELRAIRSDMKTYRADPEALFRRVFAGPIEQSLKAGKPALTYGFVITGMDDQAQPLSGYGTSGKSTRYSQETMRLKWQPWDLCVVGDRLPTTPRAGVDALSLRHIVALFNEQAQGADAPPTRFAGRRAWAEWLKMLYEARDRGGDASKYRSAWDNNVLIHLRYDRAAAVAYLRAMAGRHPGRVAERLTAAADLYQRALDELKRGELPHPGPTRGGLPAYIAMAEQVRQLETAAIALLDDAAGQLEGVPPVEGRVSRARDWTTDARTDDERLSFKGNGMVDDAVSLALQAAGRLFDVETDYDTLACLTANAFAPALNRGEDCLSHWMVEGCVAEQNLPLAARHLGLRAERLLLPAFTGSNGNEDDLRRYRQAAAPFVVGALHDGAVVLTTGGWDIRGPRGFVHWGLAGLVTEADLEGDLVGAHLWGARKHPVKYPAAMWALRAAGGPRPVAELAVEAMRQGVDRIRGRGRYAPTESFVYGLAAMDLWMDRMGNAPGYCAPCFGRIGVKAGDAANNAQRFSNLSKTAARFLRSQGERYEPAARHYDRIVELLTPALTGREDERYAAFLGDMDKQRAHVASVLAPVRAELAAAADALEAALP